MDDSKRLPYPTIPPERDKRRKLTDDEREEIRSLRDEHSTRYLAAKFKVSRRTIQFVLDPQKRLDNVERRRERVALGQRQESSEMRAEYMRRYRAHQKEVNGNKFSEWEATENRVRRQRKRKETTE